MLGGVSIGLQTRFLDGSGKYHATGHISYVLFGENGPADHYFLVEDAYTAMAIQAKNQHAVCALQGTNVSRQQMARLARLTSRVTIAFDDDEGGRRAAPRVAKRLQEMGVHAEVSWPDHRPPL